MSTLLHATVYMFLHSLLNAPVQIANTMGLQKIPFNHPVIWRYRVSTRKHR
jgi:hypothetical protein